MTLCIHLNTPKENPRWKIVAERYGFSTAEINNFERAVEMYNLYSPTSRILTAYRQQFPRENFDKIREFLRKVVPDVVAGTSGETVRVLDTINEL